MADTYKGMTVFISNTPVSAILDQAGYEALTFTQVGSVGSVTGAFGTTDNILTYNTLGTSVASKGKGVADAGNPVLEVERKSTDAGQLLLRTAGTVSDEYAFKFDLGDNPSGLTNTIIFNRGIVSGPERGPAGVEDFILEKFNLGFSTQREIVVEAT